MIIKLRHTKEDKAILTNYLIEVDSEFGVALSNKIDFPSFADKILLKGHVFLVFEDNIYCAMICLIKKHIYLYYQQKQVQEAKDMPKN